MKFIQNYIIFNLQSMNNTVIILAGGIGSRMKNPIPKQFLEINERMIIEYTIDKFLSNKYINDIIVVCNKQWIDKVKNKNLNIKIIAGGNSRFESSYIGLKACNNNTKNVLIHDAVRPFVEDDLINKAIEKLENYDATIPVVSCSDSIINRKSMKYINRDDIKMIQTPQGFKFKIILDAYKKHGKNKKSNFSDDFSLLLYYMPNIDYFFYKGNNSNFKITHQDDLDEKYFIC